ncbi:MAG: hypothetical protein KF789_11140 [Bdellovibrionaceae bacterium]|nr:hypothetical protein [Pseudobdellovibrionaceae bacterium]
MKSAILSIGTELTDGQITNRNAAWLSAKTKPLGFRCVLHLCVPDDRSRILEALRLCEEQADLILLTGGLGPTSDDFTRDLVAEWSEEPLTFDESSWRHVNERLTSRGYEVHDFQKQQCFFPRGSSILPNTQGTANGFRLQVRGIDTVVLPGPPREVEAVWNDHVEPWLKNRGHVLDPIETRAWQLVGLAEPEVNAMMEPLVQGQNLEVGYRVHQPYVEFKISFPRSQQRKALSLVQKIEETLKPWTLVKDDQDLASLLTTKLKSHRKIFVVDEVTGSFLFQRMGSALFRESGIESVQFANRQSTFADGLLLQLVALEETRIRVSWNEKSTDIEAPMKSPMMAERRKQYFAEMAMAWWLREIGS